jgi:hypothetical protein
MAKDSTLSISVSNHKYRQSFLLFPAKNSTDIHPAALANQCCQMTKVSTSLFLFLIINAGKAPCCSG